MEVQLRQYDTPFDVPLAVAVARTDVGDAVVAAGFMSAAELITQHELTISGDDLGSIDTAIREWLAGDLEALRQVPVSQSGSAFQLRVWTELSEVPAGSTCTYGELAIAAGNPGAARAVGSACAANAVAPFVPCHRVVPASGGVGEYGYGRVLKDMLLKRELGRQPG